MPRSAARRRRSEGSCRSRSPRDAGGEAGVDAASGNEQVGLDGEVRRRKAERPATRVALDDQSVDLERAAEQPRRVADVARCRSWRIADEEIPSTTGTTERRPRAGQVRKFPSRGARSGSSRRRRHPAPIASRYRSANSSGSIRWKSSENSTTSVSSTPTPPAARAAARASSAARRRSRAPARMRVEREHRRRRAGGDERLEHVAVAEMDAVERAERDRTRPSLELAGQWTTFTRITAPSTATSSPRARREPARRPSPARANRGSLGRETATRAGTGARPPARGSALRRPRARENGPTSVRRASGSGRRGRPRSRARTCRSRPGRSARASPRLSQTVERCLVDGRGRNGISTCSPRRYRR